MKQKNALTALPLAFALVAPLWLMIILTIAACGGGSTSSGGNMSAMTLITGNQVSNNTEHIERSLEDLTYLPELDVLLVPIVTYSNLKASGINANCATDFMTIYLNAEYVRGTSNSKVLGCLVHELLHIQNPSYSEMQVVELTPIKLDELFANKQQSNS